jgi:GNAT superfamily N-acetyltransferase
MPIIIRRMVESDRDSIAEAFKDWNKQRAQYEQYWQENRDSRRVTLVAVLDEQVIGYTNLVWHSDYEPFRAAGIPEIHDMNVITQFQKQGIGTALIHEAESIALQHGKRIIGIGVGLTPDYGAAQRLYPKLGYMPDGRGAQSTPWGDELFLTKILA